MNNPTNTFVNTINPEIRVDCIRQVDFEVCAFLAVRCRTGRGKNSRDFFSGLTTTPSFSGPINEENMANKYSDKKNF